MNVSCRTTMMSDDGWLLAVTLPYSLSDGAFMTSQQTDVFAFTIRLPQHYNMNAHEDDEDEDEMMKMEMIRIRIR